MITNNITVAGRLDTNKWWIIMNDTKIVVSYFILYKILIKKKSSFNWKLHDIVNSKMVWRWRHIGFTNNSIGTPYTSYDILLFSVQYSWLDLYSPYKLAIYILLPIYLHIELYVSNIARNGLFEIRYHHIILLLLLLLWIYMLVLI